MACLRAGRYARAIEALEAFLKTHPGDNRGMQLLGICLTETGDFRRGILQLEKVNAARPGQVSVLFALAGAHLRAGDSERGRRLLEQMEGQAGQAPRCPLERLAPLSGQGV